MQSRGGERTGDLFGDVNRREFLKKLGAGVIGFGALSMVPAASWTRISDQGITQDGEQLYLGLGGSNSMSGDLNMGGYNITNSGSVDTVRLLSVFSQIMPVQVLHYIGMFHRRIGYIGVHPVWRGTMCFDRVLLRDLRCHWSPRL